MVTLTHRVAKWTTGMAALVGCIALSPAHAFLTYSQGDRAKSTQQAYVPARAQVDSRALFALAGNETAKSSGKTITLMLPSGKRYEVVAERELAGYEGGRTFVGHFKTHGTDYRVFVTDQQGMIAGYMLSPEGQIEIAPHSSGKAGDVLVTSRTKAGLMNAYSFAPDFRIPDPTQYSNVANGVAQPGGIGTPAAIAEAAFGSSMASQVNNAVSAANADRAKAGGTTIDILVAYTAGMVTRYTNTAGVLARINTLVGIMNTALMDSQVSLTMRLVNATQVSYSDTIDNNDALTAISPPKPGTATPAIKTQIDALRNQYGADLVALIRPYNQAAHGGCGVAWLLGANQQGIVAGSESFGFALVSDGADTGGSGFLCLETSLAHEFGHNLGLQHDRTQTQYEFDQCKANPPTGNIADCGFVYGATSYAFGYVNAPAQFSTIMAYAPSGVTRIARYSNPNLLCPPPSGTFACGRPQSAADSADEAAAIAVGMNVVAAFRGSLPPLRQPSNDLNGDGSGDIAGLNSNGQIYYTTNRSTWVNIPGGLAQIATGDVNGDGAADVVGVSSGGGVYYSTNKQTWTQIPGSVASVATGDLNGDGKADIVGLTSGGQVYYTTNLQTWILIPGTLASISVGDIDGDGKADIVGLNSAGDIYATTDKATWRRIPGNFTKLRLGDLNGDGKQDLVGLTSAGKVYYTTDLANWILIPGTVADITVGDINGDGRADIASVTAQNIVYYTVDLTNWIRILGGLVSVRIIDLNGDGQSEIVGLGTRGSIFYTSNLTTWINIPGELSSLANK
jgi:peptidyl-Asp metalloendopeptidase